MYLNTLALVLGEVSPEPSCPKCGSQMNIVPGSLLDIQSLASPNPLRSELAF